MCFFHRLQWLSMCLLSFFCLTETVETGPRPKNRPGLWRRQHRVADPRAPGGRAPKPNTFGSDLVVLVWNCWQERVKPFVQQDGGDIEFVRLMVETMLRFWWKSPCLFYRGLKKATVTVNLPRSTCLMFLHRSWNTSWTAQVLIMEMALCTCEWWAPVVVAPSHMQPYRKVWKSCHLASLLADWCDAVLMSPFRPRLVELAEVSFISPISAHKAQGLMHLVWRKIYTFILARRESRVLLISCSQKSGVKCWMFQHTSWRFVQSN